MKLVRFINNAEFEDYLKIAYLSHRDEDNAIVPDYFRDEMFKAFNYTKEASDDFKFDRRNLVLYALRDNSDKICGVATFVKDDHLSGSIQISHLAVSKNYRKKGYGKTILDLSVDVVKKHSEEDIYQIILSTIDTKSFYEKIGMDFIGELQDNERPRYFFRKKI